MNQDSLTTSFWTMVLIQTIGSIDAPGQGIRKMPSPAHYVAIVVTWIVLFIIAGWGEGTRRATTAIGWLIVLTGLVIGPFGKTVVNLFTNLAKRYGVPSTEQTNKFGDIVSSTPTTQAPQQATANVDPYTGQPTGGPQ